MSDTDLSGSENENNLLDDLNDYYLGDEDNKDNKTFNQNDHVLGIQKPFKKNRIYKRHDIVAELQFFDSIYEENMCFEEISIKEIKELFRILTDKEIPIYLDILTSYLNEHPETKIDEMIIEIKKRESFSEFLFDFISNNYKEAFELLKIIAYLDDYLIPLDFITYIQHSLNASESASYSVDSNADYAKKVIRKQLKPLIKMSIIELKENRNNVACISINQLIQQNFQEYLKKLLNEKRFIKHLMKVSMEYIAQHPKMLSSFANNDLQHLLNYFENSSTGYYFSQSVKNKLNEIMFVIKLVVNKANFEKVIEAYESLAKFYFEVHEPLYWLKSIEIHKKCREFKALFYGEDNECVAKSNDLIAKCYERLENFDEALNWYLLSRTIRINFYGENHEEIIRSNSKIIECYRYLQKCEEVIEWLKRNRQIIINLYGDNSEKVVELNNEIVRYYKNLRKYEEAAEWRMKSRQILINLYGENHEEIIRINDEIARTYELSNKFEEAVEWYKKKRQIIINLYGKNHEKIVESNNEIALCCKCFDKYETAIKWYQKSVNIYIYLNQPYNENDLRVTDAYQDIADCHKQIGNYEEAAHLYIKCIERFEQCDRIYLSRLKEEKYYLYFQIFSCFYENACFQEAFKYYENALEHFSSEPKTNIVSYLDNLKERLDTEKEFDGKKLFISSSYDNTIKIWDINSTNNKPLRTAPHKDSQVNCLLLLRKYLLASGHSDGTIQIWDLFIDKKIETLSLRGEAIEVICFALINQEYFASYSNDEKIILWKMSSEPIGVLKFERISEINAKSTCCLCAIDGKLASGAEERSIKIWTIERNKKLRFNRDLNGHEGAVKCLLRVNISCLASGSTDSTIRLWDLTDYSCISELRGHTANVNCLVNLKNDIFASGSHDNTINIWVVKKEAPFKTIIADNQIKSLIEITGHSIASCSTDGEIKFWSFDDYSLIKTIEAHDDIISSLQPLNLEKIVHFKEIKITFES